MIEFDGVDVHYAKNHVLKGVSLSVGAGEIVALIGANAAGKTTTLRTALGLKAPSAGTLRFGGEDITKLSTVERVRRGLVLVPEGRQVFVKFTVGENLLMGGYLRPDRDRMQADLDRVYGLFPRLAERRTQRAGSMSGGEQQMLAMARALATEPAVLLIDELSMGLAPIIV
ncbi:MAG: ABC transporter ATP-binding protein, partial [Burkholderiales bacterium]